ncbi:MAG: AAA family ATPase [Thermodesulfobacteriota bacterium]
MYCNHFNLKKKPFQLSADNSFLWLGNTHARALDLLKSGVDGAQRLMVLTGDIGTGKTTLIHELRHCLPETTAVAHITDPSIERHYLFLSIAQDLGFDGLYGEGEKFAPVLWAFLKRRRQAQKKCLIIIDEAHLIPEQFLALLCSWAKFAPDKALTLILAGQLELHQVMEKKLGLSWETQVDLHAMLSPLEEKQTRDYINRRLELAGATYRIFIPEAVREVHRYTKGIPRRINIACDQAMIAAYTKDMQTVDAQTFQKAVGILKLPEVPAAVSQPVPSPQTHPANPGPRRRVRIVSTLAAAFLLAVIAYFFYPRMLSVPDQISLSPSKTPVTQKAPAVVPATTVPNIAAKAAHGDLPEPTAPLETSQAAPQVPPLERDQVPQAAAEQIAVERDKPADMDAFIKEVFIIDKADSMARALDPSPPPSSHKTPVPAVPPASRHQSSEPAYDPTSATSVQPDPDAAIDWLIRKKSR